MSGVPGDEGRVPWTGKEAERERGEERKVEKYHGGMMLLSQRPAADPWPPVVTKHRELRERRPGIGSICSRATARGDRLRNGPDNEIHEIHRFSPDRSLSIMLFANSIQPRPDLLSRFSRPPPELTLELRQTGLSFSLDIRLAKRVRWQLLLRRIVYPLLWFPSPVSC